MTTESGDRDLREAFQLFSQTSERLTEAYAELQGQVARLSSELAVANGELARRERLSLLGEMAAKLAHQLRTPLAAALLYVGHLARPGLTEADRLRFADKTLNRLRYLERLIQDLLTFVKGQQAEASRFSVHAVIDELLQVLEPQVALLGVGLECQRLGEDLEIQGERQAVLGALINLLENAVQASREGDRVRMTVTTGGAFVAFRVADEGAGIAELDRARLFEPFFTTRSEGSGLGLAIVKQTADAHGGWVEVESELARGSIFTLYLPCARMGGDREGRDDG